MAPRGLGGRAGITLVRLCSSCSQRVQGGAHDRSMTALELKRVPGIDRFPQFCHHLSYHSVHAATLQSARSRSRTSPRPGPHTFLYCDTTAARCVHCTVLYLFRLGATGRKKNDNGLGLGRSTMYNTTSMYFYMALPISPLWHGGRPLSQAERFASNMIRPATMRLLFCCHRICRSCCFLDNE